MNDILETAVTVVTRGYQGLGTPGLCGKQLFRFNPVSQNPGHLIGWPAVDHTTPCGKTVVVLSVWMHLNEILTNSLNHVSCFIDQSGTPRNTAWVWKGDRPVILFRNLCFA